MLYKNHIDLEAIDAAEKGCTLAGVTFDIRPEFHAWSGEQVIFEDLAQIS